jgi:trans-aconitate methyltransferase
MTNQSLYDRQYRKITRSQGPSPSLVSFLKSEPLNSWLSQRRHDGPWCELGCGTRSLLEDIEVFLPGHVKEECYGFDFSHEAISKACGTSHVQYQQVDLLEGVPRGGFSFILDGHFLHCLDSLPGLYQMLGKIGQALAPGGIFAAEVMMAHKAMSFDVEFNFDHETAVLYQEDGAPARIILDARDWEDLLKNTGLSLEFFVCQSSIKMIPSAVRSTPMQGDPECLRFVLRRPLVADQENN